MPRFTSITLSILLLSGMLLTATSPVALALSAVEIQKLLASDGVASDRFGNSVSVDGNRVLIGAGRVNGFASAYVFEWDGFYWVERAQLIASDAAAGDRFAFQVTLSGDTALVGAINDDDNGNDSGSVYAFVWDGISWNEQAKLTASDGAAFDYFGRSVFLDGNTALIGAFGDDDKGSFSGAVYVFERTGGVWTEQAKLVASDGAAGDRVGPRGSVAIDGDIALIGSYSDDDNGTNSGSVYVFERNGNVWTEQSRITASDGAAGDGFGRSLAYSGNTAMISAPFDDGVTGSVYVFERDGSNWNEVDKLTATDGSGLDAFGFPVALDGDTAVIGATDDDDNGSSSGSAYIFQLNGGVWTEQAKLTASDAAVLDRFGEGASISGDNVHIGALFDDDFGSESGSVYAFIIDSDDDGIRDSADNCSKNINPDQADVDQDGLGDVCDPDDDNDNVPDSYDICPATEIPESVPQVSLKPNRWALLDNDVEFDTTKKGKRWVTSRNYSTTDTAGCSCDQIIAELGLGHGHMKYGCSIGAMEYWVELVGQ